MRLSFYSILIIFSLKGFSAQAQQDSIKKSSSHKLISLDSLAANNNKTATLKNDSLTRPIHDPRKATLRSAILPGWGQAYNHEYWKIPIVYGALGVPAGFFIYNNNWYHRTRDAYDILINGGDTSKIYMQLQGLSPQSLQYYRNAFRKDRDYSVLFFLLAWALNVADATVFAHLKNFDVSGDLSMHIQPDYNINTKTSSLGFVLNLKTPSKKLLAVP